MQTVSGFFDLIKQYLGGNALYIFVIAGWMVFISRLKRPERRITLTMLAIIILAVYNPLSHALLVKLTREASTYYRFLWLLPAHIMLVFFIYEGLRRIGHLKVQFLAVCIVCVGIFCVTISKEELYLPENASQIPEDTLEVAAALEEIREAENRESIMILADLHTFNTIRQYSSKIRLLLEPVYSLEPERNTADSLGIMSMLEYNRNDIPAQPLNDYLNTCAVDYLVININNDISLSYMQRLHWQIVATTSAYHILQYQEPTFTTEPLFAAGLDTENVEVVIPGLTEEYHFLYLADLHIIKPNDEITLNDLETVLSRLQWSSVSEDVTAAEFWGTLPDILDSCNADGILLGGDMIDFCSASNVECLKQGLNRLVTPYLYVRADHDSKPYWCEELTEEQCNSLHSEMDGNQEVWCMELPEFCVAGLSNSTDQITETGLQQMNEICSKGKPVILLTHVPYQSLVDSSLQEASKKAWQDRALVWGEDCNYQPDANTEKFMDIIYASDSPVKEILCGHLHFTWDGYITEYVHEHVFSPAFEKKIGVITVKGM